MSTSLTQPNGYNPETQMVFSNPVTNTIPTKKGAPISYQRINISTKGQKELIFPTPKIFSFGVSENTDPTSGRITGYVLPLVLFDRDGASDEETQFVTTLEKIIEHCKNHVLENKDILEKYDLTRGELKKIGNALYWPSEKGKRIEGKSPVLYCKLLVNKTKDRIISNFYDATTDEPLDPMTLVQKRCHVVCALKVESIFIGRVITIQFKCREANVEMHNFSNQRLLSTKPVTKPSTKPVTKTSTASDESESGEDESGSESSASLDASPKKVVKKVVKRRIIRKKAK